MKLTKTLMAMILTASVMTSCSETSSKEDSATKATAMSTTEAVMENIMTRTSIRQFTDQPISKDTLDILVKAGMAAPTAMDKRPWAFVVVTDREMLDSLNAIKPWFNLKTATAAIVVCGNKDKMTDGNEFGYWSQDCSAATENILLAAHAYGLGAVWCGVFPNPDIIPGVTRVLGLPENIIPFNVITMGYPDENPAPKDKYNPEDIHYQRW